MIRWMILAAAALAHLSPAAACVCDDPPPLSACSVRANEAALLVTIESVTSITRDPARQLGSAVASAVIDQVFQDNTNLGLAAGDVVSIRSSLGGLATISGNLIRLCGLGGRFTTEDQWLMFAQAPATTPAGGRGRRLQLTTVPILRDTEGDYSYDDVIGGALVDEDTTAADDSEGQFCDAEDADLSVDSCDGNILEPTALQVNQLSRGCSR